MVNKKTLLRSRAFTLIEVVVVTALLGFLATILSITISNSYKSYQIGQKTVELNEQCNNAVLDFEKYSRGATEILVASPDSFVFYAYLRGDKNPAPSKISYYVEGKNMYRSVIPPVEENGAFAYPVEGTVIDKIVGGLMTLDIFSYFNESNVRLEQPLQLDLVKMAGIEISIDNDIFKLPREATMATSIQFRNLKTNL